VFNRDTIDKNIFEVPNQELPPVYYVGRDSVDNQKKIEELKKSVQEKNTEKIPENASHKILGCSILVQMLPCWPGPPEESLKEAHDLCEAPLSSEH